MSFRTKRILFNTISGILVSLIIPIIFASIFLFVLNFAYIQTPVEGFSMLPTFNMTVDSETTKGDIVYINKIKQLKRNTVVVAEVKWNSNPIIKRLVGLPGDKIEIKDEDNKYVLYVNDEIIYFKEKTDYSIDGIKGGTNEYFSNYKNYCELKENGKTYIQLGEDEYFLMGDNWGRTTDSVAHGPVKKSEIMGTVDACEEYGTHDKWFLITTSLKNIFKFN